MNLEQRTNLIATNIIYKLQNTGIHCFNELFCIYYLFIYTLNGIHFSGIYTVGFLIHFHRLRHSCSLLCSIYLILHDIRAELSCTAIHSRG